jgi:uncharacterized protein YycO
MRALFVTRPRNLGSALIRAREGSTASHCALQMRSGPVIESVFPRVRLHTAGEWAEHCAEKGIVTVDTFTVGLPREDEAEAWALGQVGKPYGLLGLLGFLLWRDLESDQAPYCSQLLMGAAKAGGFVQRDKALRRWGIAIARETLGALAR